ncbi:Dps family protein [Sandaracinobacteroides hominis]|uniref:Dps family protein n=1 Tax=Sandaracinobacteroides hominis TaxID=2780086 RepID=UPI001F48EBC7|nr:DNA starvation/stationary phase protection protein [Sandaracinobacteroides hominis]
MATQMKRTDTHEGAAFKPKTGLSAGAYAAVADAMGHVLADSYQMFIKTQGVHWNVAGPNFFGLHKLTEAQYEDLYAAIDKIAERIRALGQPAPASYTSYGKMGRIRDEEGDGDADKQVSMLIRDNGLLCQTLREAVDVAEKNNDVVTADLLTGRLAQHEQNSWMLQMIVN